MWIQGITFLLWFGVVATVVQWLLLDWFDRLRAERGRVPVLDASWMWIENLVRWCLWAPVRLAEWIRRGR